MCRFTKCVFTSNKHPFGLDGRGGWYPNIDDTSALKRRIGTIIHMTQPFAMTMQQTIELQLRESIGEIERKSDEQNVLDDLSPV